MAAGIGWHTFRPSFANVLKANGEDVKGGAGESLRHANGRITLDVYAGLDAHQAPGTRPRGKIVEKSGPI